MNPKNNRENAIKGSVKHKDERSNKSCTISVVGNHTNAEMSQDTIKNYDGIVVKLYIPEYYILFSS